MRALVVCAAPVAGSEALVAELASGAEVVVAVDGGAELCRDAGVIPDVLVGDMDSVDAETLASARADGVRIEVHPAQKDVTDLDLALALVAAEGATHVTVTAAFSGRIDHTLAACGSLARAASPMLQVDYREPNEQGWVLAAEESAETLTLRPAGALVSVVPLAGSATVSISGMRWPLEVAVIDSLASRGVSNVVVADEAIVTVHHGVALVSNPGPFAAVGSRTPAQ